MGVGRDWAKTVQTAVGDSGAVNFEGAGTVRYTMEGAAFLLRVPARTLRQWANGYTYKRDNGAVVHKRSAIKRDESADRNLINFFELIELLWVRELVKKRKDNATGKELQPLCTLDEVRDTVDNLVPTLGPYPLARANLKSLGKQTVTDQIEPGVLTNAVVMQHLLDFSSELNPQLIFNNETGLVEAWLPTGTDAIRVKPTVRFGVPVVKSNIPTETVYQRFLLEDGDLKETAYWLGIDASEVSAAVEFEEEWQKKVAYLKESKQRPTTNLINRLSTSFVRRMESYIQKLG